ncbi:hypothetical protein SAMN04487972_10411 [Paracoccus halophilus]|uniref:Flagellar export protein FliJ n=1 Tax=Paracoccus halophilus TaxID=376733 RepID=A0A099F6B3_9RHOB|nr:hypothetical protein [Paracoccus halophilus]KGJ06270.1 hypothetical protein IT41_03690 [Paracoccus halophilus]SFA45266.1 hypothetical protein SAMN04487972_10411 [Paracoccus halophilus]
MKGQTKALGRLERIARLKSDIEMRRFSAFRSHLVEARARMMQIEQELAAIHQSDAAFSVSEARLTNALACEKIRDLLAAEEEVRRLLPGFEAARGRALREFGRAEALNSLRKSSIVEA